jgi:hypothetical protein
MNIPGYFCPSMLGWTHCKPEDHPTQKLELSLKMNPRDKSNIPDK